MRLFSPILLCSGVNDPERVIEVEMTSLRKRKAAASRERRRGTGDFSQRSPSWDQMPAIGREFGSPDFERLMDEDRCKQVGVYDSALKDWVLAKSGTS